MPAMRLLAVIILLQIGIIPFAESVAAAERHLASVVEKLPQDRQPPPPRGPPSRSNARTSASLPATPPIF